jgi:hypothetical protein
MMNEKLYHIYLKENCIYHSLSKEDFEKTLNALYHLIEVVGNYQKEDLSYEEVELNRELSLASSY